MKTQIINNAISPDAIQSSIAKLREFKINGYSVFDIVLTYFVTYLISFPLAKYISRKQLFYLAIPFSVLVHTICQVHTPLTDQFWDTDGNYLIKFSVLYMIYKGLKPFKTFQNLSKHFLTN